MSEIPEDPEIKGIGHGVGLWDEALTNPQPKSAWMKGRSK